jgi:hypothetical protein
MATATTTTVSDGRHAYRPQAIGRVFGWFFLATFLTSVPAYFVGYHQMLNNPGLITGAGANPCGVRKPSLVVLACGFVSLVSYAAFLYSLIRPSTTW